MRSKGEFTWLRVYFVLGPKFGLVYSHLFSVSTQAEISFPFSLSFFPFSLTPGIRLQQQREREALFLNGVWTRTLPANLTKYIHVDLIVNTNVKGTHMRQRMWNPLWLIGPYVFLAGSRIIPIACEPLFQPFKTATFARIP